MFGRNFFNGQYKNYKERTGDDLERAARGERTDDNFRFIVEECFNKFDYPNLD